MIEEENQTASVPVVWPVTEFLNILLPKLKTGILLESVLQNWQQNINQLVRIQTNMRLPNKMEFVFLIFSILQKVMTYENFETTME